MTIDWNLIAQFEGKGERIGYVPNPATTNSGVTVATGVDLGQHDLASLQAMQLDPDLITTLTPYLGLKKYEAVVFLQSNPLVLTADQVNQIDTAEHKLTADQLSAHYNSCGGNWDSVPDAPSTCIASVAFQYGINLDKAAPHFWRQALAQDWNGMYQNLLNFGDAYSVRRHAEAGYLKQYLDTLTS